MATPKIYYKLAFNQEVGPINQLNRILSSIGPEGRGSHMNKDKKLGAVKI